MLLPFNNREYHEDTEYVTCSALTVFSESRPLFEGRYITKNIAPPKQTPDMALGTAVHLLALEPDKEHLIKVAPKYEGEGAKARKKAFEEGLGRDDIALSQSDADQARFMADAVRRHKWARTIIDMARHREQAVACDLDGVPCKALLDCEGDLWGIADLKTCESIFDWSRTVQNRHYHRQAAFHLDVAQCLPDPPSSFFHICVDKSEVCEVAVIPMSQEYLDLGRAWFMPLLAELAACREAGVYASRWANEQPPSYPLPYSTP